jgi:hypothetical protein
VLICHNVAKYTELYRGYLRFNAIFSGDARCLKIVLQRYFKCCCVAGVTKTFTLKGVLTIQRSASHGEPCLLLAYCSTPGSSHSYQTSVNLTHLHSVTSQKIVFVETQEGFNWTGALLGPSRNSTLRFGYPNMELLRI